MKMLALIATIILTGCVATQPSKPTVRQDPYNLESLRAAAEAGAPEAQYRYGLSLYEAGYASRSMTDQKFSDVMGWYRKAAAGGNVKAKTNLGHLLRTHHKLQDFNEAVPLLMDAANSGDMQAEYNFSKG